MRLLSVVLILLSLFEGDWDGMGDHEPCVVFLLMEVADGVTPLIFLFALCILLSGDCLDVVVADSCVGEEGFVGGGGYDNRNYSISVLDCDVNSGVGHAVGGVSIHKHRSECNCIAELVGAHGVLMTRRSITQKLMCDDV